MKKIIFVVVETLLISTIVLFAVSPLSCSANEHGLQILKGDYIPPTLETFENLSTRALSFTFSKPITLANASISKRSKNDDENFFYSENAKPKEKISVSLSYENDGSTVVARASNALAIGEQYAFYAEASDTNGNSLSFCVPFSGWNENPATLFISGVYTLYSSKYNRHEFVELECAQSGNLAGFSISAVAQKKLKLFTFPSCEVLQGEKIVLHFYKNENCFAENENEKNTKRSRGWYCSNKTRDFWIAENEKTSLLSDNKGIVVLENENTKKIVDAFLYASNDNEDWKNSALTSEAKTLAEAGFIADESIESAFRFKKLSSSTKSTEMFSRQNKTWTIKELAMSN